MPKLQSKIHALAVVAHPDDESYLVTGVTRKLLEEKKYLGVVCATHGEKGADRLNRNLSRKQMSVIRTKEILSAAKIIGCKFVDFYNYPDGGLANINIKLLTKRIISSINKYQPEIVITFGKEGISGHHDHITIGKATIEAIKQSKHKPKEAWLMSLPASIIGKFNENISKRRVHLSHFKLFKLKGVPDEKLLKLNISKYSDLKLRAIKAHESQHIPGLIMNNFLRHEYFQIVKIKP